MVRIAAVVVGMGLLGCSRSPETVVHFAPPQGAGTWEVRDPAGARLCAPPCTVGLDAHDSVVLARRGGTLFVVQQDALGPGAFHGDVRVRYEQRPGALAVEAFSGALLSAGVYLLNARRDDRVAAGIVLSGLGTAGLLASNAWSVAHEELWIQRSATP